MADEKKPKKDEAVKDDVVENAAAAPSSSQAAGEGATPAAVDAVADASAEKAEEKKAAAKKPVAKKAPAKKASTKAAAEKTPAAKKEAAADAKAEESEAEEAPKKAPAKKAPAKKAGSTTRAKKPAPEVAADPTFVRATARYVRSSPRKARLVVDHIRGESVEDARVFLQFTARHVGRDVAKVLESAVANAEHNHELSGDDLHIVKAFVDEGPTLKRWRPRAKGRATQILKRTSHITVVVSDVPAKQLNKRKAAA